MLYSCGTSLTGVDGCLDDAVPELTMQFLVLQHVHDITSCDGDDHVRLVQAPVVSQQVKHVLSRVIVLLSNRVVQSNELPLNQEQCPTS